MNKIAVIQIIDSLSAGGAEVLAVNIANELAKNDDVHSYLCTTREEGILKKQLSDKVSYLFLKRKKTIDLSSIYTLRRFIKKNNIQIIHAHSSSLLIAVFVKLSFPKIKIVWHDHYGKNLSKRPLFPVKQASFFINHIFAVNYQLLSWDSKNLFCKKITVLNNFPSFNNENLQTNLFGNHGKRIVCMAAFRPQKDHINLLEAFRIFNEDYPDWSLHLIGNDHEDAYSLMLKNYIKINNLVNKVYIYGVKSDIKHILSQASLGVLSSKSEGLPIALLEYGLAHLPVLVTDVGACSLVVKKKEALVPPENSELFAKSLVKLISNQGLLNEVADNLSKEVNKKYNKKSIIKEVIRVYKIYV
ncbi:glycosyl transferase [Polaribacter pacificus]|uniref:Glycosyl transferase n=1 Tax=Polaribacter pacificus TaxID=1775173 RepID=A0A917I0H1_9FLAO|nr:glycosyltransferase [Polaribacter pacificus]GGG99504.1 glycosyl transferase [Polaribacter pacificus]